MSADSSFRSHIPAAPRLVHPETIRKGQKAPVEAKHGFHFRKRREPINWRLLSSINVERLIREVDISLLQDILQNLTFCDVESEDLGQVDPNLLKLFQLSQLTIEYLLYSQEYLESKRGHSEVTAKTAEEQLKALQELERKHDKEIEVLTKENRQLKKTVYAYQVWTKTPGGLSNNQPVASAYHRCRYCTKVFNSDYFLESHLVRRHGDRPNYLAEVQNMPPIMFPAQKSTTDVEVIDKITTTIEKFSNKVMETERALRAEMEARLAEEIAKRERAMQDGQHKEQRKFETELHDLKAMMVRQLEDEKRLLREERAAFELARKKGSNIGNLEDDDEIRKRRREEDMLRKLEAKYDQAFDQLQSNFELQLGGIKTRLASESEEKLAQMEREKRQLEKLLEKTTGKLETLEHAVRSSKQNLVPKKASNESLEMWHVYRTMLDSFKAPLPRFSHLKSKHGHSTGAMSAKILEVQLHLDAECEKMGITAQIVADAEAVEQITARLKKQSHHVDKSRPCGAHMRAYLEEKLNETTAKSFRLKPLVAPTMIPTSATIPLPDKATYFPALRSPIVANRSAKSLNSSIASEVNWDSIVDKSESESESSASESSDEPVQISPYTSKTDVSAPVKKLEVAPEVAPEEKKKVINTFTKAFANFRDKKAKKEQQISAEPTPQVQPALKLDAKLFQAIGHVAQNNKHSPLETDAKIEDEFEVSDISESIDGDDEADVYLAPAPAPVLTPAVAVPKITSEPITMPPNNNVQPLVPDQSYDSPSEDLSALLRDVASEIESAKKPVNKIPVIPADDFEDDDDLDVPHL